MGFPEALIAATQNDYVAAIVRLADDAAWLGRCRQIAAAMKPGHPFFDGDPGLFAEALANLTAEAAARATADA